MSSLFGGKDMYKIQIDITKIEGLVRRTLKNQFHGKNFESNNVLNFQTLINTFYY